MSKQRTTIGEVRQQFARDLIVSIEAIANSRIRKANYYILVTCHWTSAKVLSEKLILMSQKPPAPMLGTMLFYIDNFRGLVKICWILPEDTPTDQFEMTTNKAAEKIFKGAKIANMPIIW